MSLVDLALRTSTMFALKGKTLAGANVFNSPSDPLTKILDGGEDGTEIRTVLAIYTNSGDSLPEGKSFQNGKFSAEVTLQIYIPWTSGIKAADDELGEIKGRDEGGAFILDLIAAEIDAALLPSASPWAEIRSNFITGFGHIKRQSFVLQVENKNIEVMAKETVSIIETIADPTPGDPLDFPWVGFLAAMESEGSEYVSLATALRARLQGTLSVTEWQRVVAALGVNAETARALGLGPGPADELPANETPLVPLSQITLDNEFLDDDVIVDDGAHVTEP